MLQERRQAALSEIERECSEELTRETSRMQKSLCESRMRRMEGLREEKEREAEAAEAEIRLRSELELAREIAALRAECRADVERAGVAMAENEEAEARPMLEAACKRMTRRVKERVAEADSACSKSRHELVQALRTEWKDMLAIRRPHEMATNHVCSSNDTLRSAHLESNELAPTCLRCVELERRLATVQGEDASLRGAVADLRRRLDELKASANSGHVAPRVPPRKILSKSTADAQIQTLDAGETDIKVRGACTSSHGLLCALCVETTSCISSCAKV
jgi:hypothetical protein